MNFLKKGKTNWKFLLIIIALVLIIFGGIFYFFLSWRIGIVPIFSNKCEVCKKDFIAWCENCRSLGWPLGIAGSPILSSKTAMCLMDCFLLKPLPKTNYCYDKRNLCENFGIVGGEVCENLCGDGTCQETVCLAVGCPCAETKENCPQDCGEEISKLETGCIESGGTVTTTSCCLAVNDFPNNCLIGACGCSPENSHQIKNCDCGEEKCFDGKKCTFKEATGDETADWKTYQWNGLEFRYPQTWNVEKIYYQTPAQQAQGEPPENIGLTIFPGTESTGNDFIAIGGHQVSCDPSENHTKCQFVSSISNFVYTDSNNPDILKVFDQILSTFRFLE